MNARTSLILLLFFGWSAGSWYWYTCKIKGFCPGANATAEAPAIAVPDPEPVIAEPEVVDSSPLVFQWSDANPITNEDFVSYKTDVLSDLKDNQILQVIGKYYSGEVNNSQFDNLGVARAENIKALLSDALDTAKIETRGQLADDIGDENNPFEAVGFRYLIRSEVVQEIDDKILIYFPYNSSQKEVNPEIDSYLDNLAGQLKDTDQRVAITGHTDNLGNDKSNHELGLSRAKSVKDILANKGVAPERISASSQGEAQPIASNETDEGRSKNRRIELKVE